MHKQLSHPSAKQLLEETKRIFQEKDIFFSLNKHIVFVCGGTKRTSFRKKFLTYTKNYPSELHIFLADDAVNDLLSTSNPEFINLADFEELIAEIFDSILIFPESPGSFAELGYFSKVESLQKKCLVVNEIQFQMDSFINLGPISLIDSKSDYRPTVYIDKKTPDFKQVVKRLLRFHEKRIQRDRYRYRNYKEINIKEKFATVLELIRIFLVVNIDGLEKCFKVVFGRADPKELKRFISILLAGKYIKRVGSGKEYYCLIRGVKTLLEYDHVDIEELSARVNLYYKNNDEISYKLIQEEH